MDRDKDKTKKELFNLREIGDKKSKHYSEKHNGKNDGGNGWMTNMQELEHYY